MRRFFFLRPGWCWDDNMSLLGPNLFDNVYIRWSVMNAFFEAL